MLKGRRNLDSTTLVSILARFDNPDIFILAFFVFPAYSGLDTIVGFLESLVLRVFFVLRVGNVIGFRDYLEGRLF